MKHHPKLIFIHSSDELYGADRVLIEMVATVPESVDVEVWLPNDLVHPDLPLCQELVRRHVAVRHLALPIMRRANQNPRGLWKLFSTCWRLLLELRQTAPTAVYCTTSPTFLAAPVARLAGVHKVIGHTQEIWSAADRRILSRPARSCHTLLAISAAVSRSLPPALQARTVVVPNGTAEPRSQTPHDARSGPLEFLVASRWNGWKGHRTLLKAWDLARAPGRLTVLGGPPPSGESVDVRALVAKLESPGTVAIVGEVPDPSIYLEQADVVLMPSDQSEPFGLVAIEAFARGRPVIGSAGGGLLDIVTHGVDGWLFPPRDSEALGILLADLTRDKVVAAGVRARQTYLQRFTVDRFKENWRQAVFGV